MPAVATRTKQLRVKTGELHHLCPNIIVARDTFHSRRLQSITQCDKRSVGIDMAIEAVTDREMCLPSWQSIQSIVTLSVPGGCPG